MGQRGFAHFLPDDDVFLHLIPCDADQLMLEVRLEVSNVHLALREPRLYGWVGCPASGAHLVPSNVAEADAICAETEPAVWWP
jgi:hypothetical protein